MEANIIYLDHVPKTDLEERLYNHYKVYIKSEDEIPDYIIEEYKKDLKLLQETNSLLS